MRATIAFAIRGLMALFVALVFAAGCIAIGYYFPTVGYGLLGGYILYNALMWAEEELGRRKG